MNLLEILSRTTLLKDENTKQVLSKALRKAFDTTDSREEAETLILLAHKYNLEIRDEMLDDLNYSEWKIW